MVLGEDLCRAEMRLAPAFATPQEFLKKSPKGQINTEFIDDNGAIQLHSGGWLAAAATRMPWPMRGRSPALLPSPPARPPALTCLSCRRHLHLLPDQRRQDLRRARPLQLRLQEAGGRQAQDPLPPLLRHARAHRRQAHGHRGWWAAAAGWAPPACACCTCCPEQRFFCARLGGRHSHCWC
jgi:hypothetical protein